MFNTIIYDKRLEVNMEKLMKIKIGLPQAFRFEDCELSSGILCRYSEGPGFFGSHEASAKQVAVWLITAFKVPPYLSFVSFDKKY
jgi:hypothetical protein